VELCPYTEQSTLSSRNLKQGILKGEVSLYR
jgi:hypothetical protein